MSGIRFAWDQRKSAGNAAKHGVTFTEAASVFYDDCAVEFYDEAHSEGEDRFLLLGLSAKARLLLVCHCHREGDKIIRIISARKATKNEAQYYHR